jgi:hypothetical protein
MLVASMFRNTAAAVVLPNFLLWPFRTTSGTSSVEEITTAFVSPQEFRFKLFNNKNNNNNNNNKTIKIDQQNHKKQTTQHKNLRQ